MSMFRSRWLWTALGVASAYYLFSRQSNRRRMMNRSRGKGILRQAARVSRSVLDGAVDAMRR